MSVFGKFDEHVLKSNKELTDQDQKRESKIKEMAKILNDSKKEILILEERLTGVMEINSMLEEGEHTDKMQREMLMHEGKDDNNHSSNNSNRTNEPNNDISTTGDIERRTENVGDVEITVPQPVERISVGLEEEICYGEKVSVEDDDPETDNCNDVALTADEADNETRTSDVVESLELEQVEMASYAVEEDSTETIELCDEEKASTESKYQQSEPSSSEGHQEKNSIKLAKPSSHQLTESGKYYGKDYEVSQVRQCRYKCRGWYLTPNAKWMIVSGQVGTWGN